MLPICALKFSGNKTGGYGIRPYRHTAIPDHGSVLFVTQSNFRRKRGATILKSLYCLFWGRLLPPLLPPTRKFSTVSTLSTIPLRACALRKERIRIGFIIVVVVIEYDSRIRIRIRGHLLASACKCNHTAKRGKMWKTLEF